METKNVSATKKQVAFILKLLSRMHPEQVIELTKKYDINNLTKKQAHQLINELIRLKWKKNTFIYVERKKFNRRFIRWKKF